MLYRTSKLWPLVEGLDQTVSGERARLTGLVETDFAPVWSFITAAL